MLFMHLRTRLELHSAMRQMGRSSRQTRIVVDAASDDLIDYAAERVGATNKMDAIGDGTIWAAIVAFFKSPEGQALIQMLLKLLLGALFAENPAELDKTFVKTFGVAACPEAPEVPLAG